MEGVSEIVLIVLGSAVLVALAGFGIVSLREQEARAARVAFALAVLAGLPLICATVLAASVRVALLWTIVVAVALFWVLWFAPIGRRRLGGRPSRRVDERDIMFARARLKPGSREFDSHYAMRPEHRAGDDRTRALPGLLSLSAEKAQPVQFAAAEASFAITEALRDEVDGDVCERRIEREPAAWAASLKRLAHFYGAVSVGITELRPFHIYSHVGRGAGAYGEEVTLDHRWAVAFAVEMGHAHVACAPEAPVILESAREYVESAKIAIHVASVIRSMGYPARAHIDGNYRVIAPLVARDAGLGEIGRMGILMTPRLGPRVRLGVVTTDMPLVADDPGDDSTVIDFCTICRKCAVNCPVGAIPFGARTRVDGGLRWRIDDQTCYRYWNLVGTDCATCMRVCPFSHPDSVAHNLVRAAIRRSGAARRALLRMDDLFYGRRPTPRLKREVE